MKLSQKKARPDDIEQGPVRNGGATSILCHVCEMGHARSKQGLARNGRPTLTLFQVFEWGAWTLSKGPVRKGGIMSANCHVGENRANETWTGTRVKRRRHAINLSCGQNRTHETWTRNRRKGSTTSALYHVGEKWGS